MSSEQGGIDQQIKHSVPWAKLPTSLKQTCSQKEYDKKVYNFSIQDQLRWKGNLVRTVKKEERKYYEEVLEYSRKKLMLYPYHLADVMVKGLRHTPFSYYVNMMNDIMAQEKSYDSLPNFTAADGLRLLGIGRNEYIDLMNQCRSGKKLFRRAPIRDLLPTQPVGEVGLEPWWHIQHGYVTEDDVKLCRPPEKEVLDAVIDGGTMKAGDLDRSVVLALYKRGLIYFDVPIEDTDKAVVPTLEGFVMNRTQGDTIETRLYDVFFSMDQHSTVAELASVLQIDQELVKDTMSVLCRLKFALKKDQAIDIDLLHPSWKRGDRQIKKAASDQLIIDWSALEEAQPQDGGKISSSESSASLDVLAVESVSPSHTKRIGLVFDSTLTAFLMMGNLSPGLKSHAVTMFEVGKLPDESMESFLAELEKSQQIKVSTDAEGEAQRYFEHASTLRESLRFLRANPELQVAGCRDPCGVDLLRCESLRGLDGATRGRLLNRNYSVLLSLAPVTQETEPVSTVQPPHVGPPISEVSSPWFKLLLYQLTGSGPPSLLLRKGYRLKCLPDVLVDYERLMITTWGHDPAVISASNILLTLNDALTHSAVLVQAHGWSADGNTLHVAFPVPDNNKEGEGGEFSSAAPQHHPCIRAVEQHVQHVRNTCGYVTLLCTGRPSAPSPLDPKNGLTGHAALQALTDELEQVGGGGGGAEMGTPLSSSTDDWVLLDCHFGLPLFDAQLSRTVLKALKHNALLSQDKLKEQVHSSRLLSLQLLDFVSSCLDKPLSRDGDMVTGGKGVPLPSHNLLFSGGNLSVWP